MQNESDAAGCPECGGTVSVRRPVPGQQVPCRHCGVLLEVVWRHPITLALLELDDDDVVVETIRRRRSVRQRRRISDPQRHSEDRY